MKTRIIAKHQQIVRVDREKRIGLNPMQIDRVLLQVAHILPSIDAIIFEDYGKGLICQDVADQIIRLANEAGKIVTVDPNPRNLLKWASVTAITPNRAEAFAAAGHGFERSGGTGYGR